ncbi:MAG: hypothetical protein PF692_11630, partial [Kiritimatiellae bacterium]|nr:hypothetical protein [Kiritimatiellia bacterium]
MFTKNLSITLLLTIAMGLLAQDIDMFTPEMIKIRENYVTKQSELDKQRTAELSNLISSCLKLAEKQENEQKRRGNISAMAAAQKMVRQLNKYQEELYEKGDFELSSKSRRETKAISDKIAAGKPVIDNKYAELQKETLAKSKDTFKKAAMKQHNLSALSQEKVDAEFEKLTKTKAPETVPQLGTNDTSSAKTPVDSMFEDYLA